MKNHKSKVGFYSVIGKIRFPFLARFEDEHGFDFLNKRQWQFIVLFIIAFIWGTSFILMKKGLESFTAEQVAALRIFLSFIFFLPFIAKRLTKLSKDNFKYLLIVGFIGNAFPALLFTIGQTELSSSFAGILNSLVPLFTLFVGLMFFRTRTAWKNIAGIVLGLLGTVGLILKGEDQFATGNMWFSLFIILATIFYSISANVIKEKLKELDGLSITTLSFLLIGPFAGIYLLFLDLPLSFHSPNAFESFTYIVYLSFFSSFMAGVIFNVLIKYTSTIFATSVTYIIPVFAVLWGLSDGESISLIQILFMLIILAGIYLVNRKVE